MMQRTANCFVAVLSLFLLSCGGGGSSGSSGTAGLDYAYQVPPQHSDGWAVSSLEAEAIDAFWLVDMMNLIPARGHDAFLRNILIVKNNKLVFEEYFNDTNINTLSHLQSATKSVVSAIFGIAADNGLVSSTDDAVFVYFPEYQHLSNTQKKRLSASSMYCR